MTCRLIKGVICIASLALLPVSGTAAPIANCNPAFTQCGIPEEISLQLPFLAISGDAIVVESNHTTVSDVFRIFNNFLDTGEGTGLGDLVFLYSADDGPLPAPSTYSANAVTIVENPSGSTHYLGNGTDYVLGVPEPYTFVFLGLGIVVMAVRKRKHLKS